MDTANMLPMPPRRKEEVRARSGSLANHALCASAARCWSTLERANLEMSRWLHLMRLYVGSSTLRRYMAALARLRSRIRMRFLMPLSRAGFFCIRPADTNGALEYLRHSPIQACRKVSPWAFVMLKGILACGCQYTGGKKPAGERTSLSSLT
jgi:hypothetical protein